MRRPLYPFLTFVPLLLLAICVFPAQAGPNQGAVMLRFSGPSVVARWSYLDATGSIETDVLVFADKIDDELHSPGDPRVIEPQYNASVTITRINIVTGDFLFETLGYSPNF